MRQLTIQDAIKTDMHIWIYGAGIIGRRIIDVLECMKRMDRIDGVVVTKKDQESMQVKEYKVQEIDQVSTSLESTVFIIAVSKKYEVEVLKELESRGYNQFILWDNTIFREKWKIAEYCFEDRKKNWEKVCFILAGYKEYLWENIFERFQKFVPHDVEVCILSSGKYSARLSEIAKENNWSYLSTSLNSVTAVQNIAIENYPYAEWIYKMDEDIFVTEGCFEKMFDTYQRVEQEQPYQMGFSTVLIPVNGYGHIRILNKLGKKDIYEEKFDKVLYGGHPQKMIEKSADAAKFMWGADGNIPRLDELNRQLKEREEEYSFCNVRYSIGFVLFHREFWELLKGFTVTGSPDMGRDEEEMCRMCMVNSYAIAVCENAVVGHFSFGQQTEGMKEYYEKYPEFFKIMQN